MEEKIEHAKELIATAIKRWPKIAIACSFGKDSIVVSHIAKQVDPNIKIFSVMTRFKPKETYEYLKMMNKKMNLNTTVYIVADSVPKDLEDDDLTFVLLPAEEFEKKQKEIKETTGKEIYIADPDDCCRMLKVEPTKVAVKDIDAWICGLRCNEGPVRKDYCEIQEKGGLFKVNPILEFTEAEIWRYLSTRGITPNPLYAKGYRSLGCAPCSKPGGKYERDGRWIGTSKCGGECGIHTKRLK